MFIRICIYSGLLVKPLKVKISTELLSEIIEFIKKNLELQQDALVFSGICASADGAKMEKRLQSKTWIVSDTLLLFIKSQAGVTVLLVDTDVLSGLDLETVCSYMVP